MISVFQQYASEHLSDDAVPRNMLFMRWDNHCRQDQFDSSNTERISTTTHVFSGDRLLFTYTEGYPRDAIAEQTADVVVFFPIRVGVPLPSPMVELTALDPADHGLRIFSMNYLGELMIQTWDSETNAWQARVIVGQADPADRFVIDHFESLWNQGATP